MYVLPHLIVGSNVGKAPLVLGRVERKVVRKVRSINLWGERNWL